MSDCPAPVSHPPPSERRHTGLSPPPHRHQTSSVSRTISLLVRRFPLFLREPSPPGSPHLTTRLGAIGRASPPSCAWPPRGDHGRCACAVSRLSRPGRVAARPCQSGREAVTAGCRSRPPRPIGLRARAGFSPALCEFLLKSFLFVLIPRK
jgi:hypothetical protein